MTDKPAEERDIDDFPSSPHGSFSAQEYYESFLKCLDYVRAIPTKELGEDKNYEVHRLLTELHDAEKAGNTFYRRRQDASEALTSLWLARAKDAARMFAAFHNPPQFQGIEAEDLVQLAKVSADKDGLKKIGWILIERGIILTTERPIPGIKLDGAVYRIESGHPVITLSLRYSRLDHFWFTLMHELAHIVLHLEEIQTPIIDNLDDEPEDRIEKQADRLALNSLIPRSDWRSCQAKYDLKEESINDFAAMIGIHPAIVAGRLSREMGKYELFSKLLNSVNVRKVLWGDE